jgi:hypothetical protein
MQPPSNSYAREYGRHTPPQRKGVPDNAGFDKLVSDFKKSGPIKTVDLNDDDEFRALVRHCLLPQEQLGEFMARTGLGKATILSRKMTPDQITEHVRRVEANEDLNGPPSHWKPRRVPSHFTLEE